MFSVYIVDDDVQTCELLQATCEPLFDNTLTYLCAKEFLLQALFEHDVVLLDLQMPDIDGIETIRHLAAKNCQAALVLISGYDQGVLASAEELARNYGLNVLETITKPFDLDILLNVLSGYVYKANCPTHQAKRAAKPIFTVSEADLLTAIVERQLVLFYQPQIDLQTNKVVGAEALVRWLHPEHGMIFPDAFINVAECSGLIEQLTSCVIDLAVEQSVLWHKQGKSIQISVNVSAQNIASLSMPEQLSVLVEANKLDPSMIVLELTESALMTEQVTSLDILTRLRLKGFQLSIDDFGTGYSSLSQLHRVPFTELKVDRSFVSHISGDEQCLAIVETCIMLGHKLNMKVVAEGIENMDVFATLRQLGCDIGQGYLFAKPMPVNDFDVWYEQNSLQPRKEKLPNNDK